MLVSMAQSSLKFYTRPDLTAPPLAQWDSYNLTNCLDESTPCYFELILYRVGQKIGGTHKMFAKPGNYSFAVLTDLYLDGTDIDVMTSTDDLIGIDMGSLKNVTQRLANWRFYGVRLSGFTPRAGASALFHLDSNSFLIFSSSILDNNMAVSMYSTPANWTLIEGGYAYLEFSRVTNFAIKTFFNGLRITTHKLRVSNNQFQFAHAPRIRVMLSTFVNCYVPASLPFMALYQELQLINSTLTSIVGSTYIIKTIGSTSEPEVTIANSTIKSSTTLSPTFTLVWVYKGTLGIFNSIFVFNYKSKHRSILSFQVFDQC